MEMMKKSINAILANINTATKYLDEDTIEEFLNGILNANNVFLMGAGRSGLVARAFAMRLMHLGISTYVIGETITPAINEGDCLIAVSGSGETESIVDAVKKTIERKAFVMSLTSNEDSSIAKCSKTHIYIKGRNKEDIDKESESEDYTNRQIEGNYTFFTPLGTAFEITSLVFLDGLITELMGKMGKTEADLKARHAKLE